MQTLWSDVPEDEFIHEASPQPCAACGAMPPTPPPAYIDAGGGIEYLMMRGTWFRYMGLGKGTWFKVRFDGLNIIATPRFAPGFRMLHMPAELLREVHYTQVREYRHHPRPRRRTRR